MARIDTHISILFLAGARVFKLKRALTLPFLDYGTAEKRRHYCELELRLNRRTAPDLYLGVRAVTREADGRLALDGSGVPVDWVVEMVRFDADGLFDARAAAGTLSEEMVRAAADAVVALHDEAEIVRQDRGGDETGLAPTIDEIGDGLRRYGALLPVDAVDAYVRDLRRSNGQQRALLARRFAAGWVRVCHGDLHLGNICTFAGRPTLFDAAEANERFTRIDVLYDLAFLVMDLQFHGLDRHANAALNRYVSGCGDVFATLAGLAAFPFFQSLRAGIRSEISAMMAARDASGRAREHAAAARRYFDLAQALLAPAPPALVAVGGASGTGKTMLARALAPHLGARPGALVVRSDAVRKNLFGVAETVRLPAAAYTPEWHDRTYAEVKSRARAVLASGYACIIDAVHASARDRAACAAIAAQAGVPFQGVWLDAPARLLRDRVDARRDDASDADRQVVVRQMDQGFGDIRWPRLDAAAPAAEVADGARALLAAGPVTDCLR